MIEPQDDHPHPTGPEPAWSESYYFNFSDPTTGLAGFTRIGFRPNEGQADGNLFLFLPEGGAVAVMNREPTTANPEVVAVGGLKYERGFDLTRWVVECSGSAIAVEQASDLDIAETRGRSAGGRIVRVQIALSYVAFMPPFGTSGRTRRTEDADAAAKAVATGHFEQACRVKGVVKVGNRRLEVQGIGVRDKSWGPRDWSAVWGWRWFSIPFDRERALGVHSLILPGREVQAGWVWRDHRLVKVKRFTLDSDFDGRFHRAMRIVAEDVEGTKYEVEGAVRSVIPLRIGATRVAEGLTDFTMDGRTATGIAEYLDNTRNA
ncbi:MAG: hypothetical protein WEB06_16495 [Actinomycetota bacterium]